MNLGVENKMFNEIWQLRKKYHTPNMTDEQVTKMLEEATVIHRRYGETKMCHDLLWAVMNEFDRTYKHLLQKEAV